MSKCNLEEIFIKANRNLLEIIKNIDPQELLQCAANGCEKCKPYANIINKISK